MDGSERRHTDWHHDHEKQLREGCAVRFELFVRALGAPAGSHQRQSAVLDRIDRLDQRDVVETVRTTVWGDCVCVSECCANHPAVRSTRDRIQQFEEWGAEYAPVSTPFDRREIRSSITGEEYAVVNLPTICLAVYLDSDLDAVLPVAIDGNRWTVSSYLDWFERVTELEDTAVLVDA